MQLNKKKAELMKMKVNITKVQFKLVKLKEKNNQFK